MMIRAWQDVERLLAEGAVEGQRLDFKREAPPGNEKIVATMCAYANALGGSIIIGAEYDDDRTRKLTGFPGVPLNQRLADRLEQVSLHVSPRISVEVTGPILVPGTLAPNERGVYAAYVHPGQLPPHMSSLDSVYYVRSGSHNARLPENIVEQMYYARYATEDRVEGILGRSFHSIQFPHRQTEQYWVTVGVIPLHPREDLLPSTSELRELLCASGQFFGGRLGVLDTDFGYEFRSPVTDFGAKPASDFTALLRVFHNGLCVFGFRHEASADRVVTAHVRDIIREALRLADRVLTYARYGNFCTIVVKLWPAGNRLLVEPGTALVESIRREENQLLLRWQCTADELRSESTIDQLMAQLRRGFGIAA
ncbi:MAG: hypothetical protein Greene041662_1020 [Candidatus Peregrinibacteria bacterium Greene0416_62]|nr:MAG: hypothetical protein Greene041662_1020 [Candidatus Peregrinibacteria bacterium Greene0416_62]